MGDLIYSHTYRSDGGRDPRHTWAVVGELGGVHIWAAESHEDIRAKFGDRFYGGVEVHSRSPIYENQHVSHDNCWLIGGTCYHDGSSLYFSENIEPMLRGIDGETVPELVTEYLNRELLDWYRDKLVREVAQ